MSKALHPIYHVRPSKALCGVIRVPGDKSISHRSIMLGAIAKGKTRIKGFLQGADSLATLAAFRAMGVTIEGPDDKGEVLVHGVGMRGLKAPSVDLDLGNSGTSMRLLSGLLAGQSFPTTLVGDESLSSRPMRRVTDPLTTMGAKVEAQPDGTPPLKISGASLNGIEYQMPMASAQVKSALLLAGLYAEGKTCVTEPAPTRDHTERMLSGFGCPVEVQGATRCVHGGAELQACDIDVPSDISSAAFFLVAASIVPGSDITLQHVGLNPTRIGVINVLRQMGANLEISNERTIGGEPVADIRVRSASLSGIDIPPDQVPLAIDEFPVLFVAAAFASGKTRLRGAEELRVKESDRIAAMANGLKILGVNATPFPDGIDIEGGHVGGGVVDSEGDHRIAMAFAVAGLQASDTIHIERCLNVQTSFPNFAELMQRLGASISVEEA